jgi:hypothetical protein
MLYLPIACGVSLPPHVITLCFSTQSSSPVMISNRTV